MALSLPPQGRDKLKNLLICISLGNFCFLRRWYDLEHLQQRAVDYYRVRPADPSLLIATLIAALILALMFWLAWIWLQRNPTSGRVKFAQSVFLLILIFPLESVRRYWNMQTISPDLASNISLLSVESVLAFGVGMVLLGNPRMVGAAKRATLLLTLLLPSLVIDFTWTRLGAEAASAYQPKPPAPMLAPRPGPPRRLIWIIFDEFDQRLAFNVRPQSLQMPQIDRLRAESLFANRATQTAAWTTLAVPCLVSGRIFSRADLIDADELEIYEDSQGPLDWARQPNVFTGARQLGVNSELVGWHHPYCRVFGDTLVRCLDVPSGHPTAALLRETQAAEEGVLRTVPFLFRIQFENLRDMFRSMKEPGSDSLRDVYVQQRQQRQYLQIRDRAYAGAVDKQIDFLFVHFPVPHLFAIYDRRRQDYKLSSSIDYLDNLALVDRTVGEFRQALEHAGLWDETSLLITSDHGLRPDLWRGRLGWTDQLEKLTAGGLSPNVPFVLKLAGQREGVVYDRSFSNVVSADLSLAVLSGQVSTAKQAAAWLDEHSRTDEKTVR
jgi:hypothetical protein